MRISGLNNEEKDYQSLLRKAKKWKVKTVWKTLAETLGGMVKGEELLSKTQIHRTGTSKKVTAK